MTTESVFPCHVCGAAAVELYVGFECLRRATSDCRPWPAGGTLGTCVACGAVQHRIDAEWHIDTNKVYSGYQAYRQSIGGAEQHVFDPITGVAIPRSQKILRWLRQTGQLSLQGRMLDVGCGNGAMLRAFSAVAGQWELNGYEPHLASDSEVRAIPRVCEVWSGDINNTGGNYDLLTLSHSLEHVEDPIAYLTGLRNRLAPNGRLLIEVPYFPDSPYDLLVADHCTHFTIGVLNMVMQRAGYLVDILRSDVIAKELTAVARPAESSGQADALGGQNEVGVTADAVADAVDWLQATRMLARAASNGAKRFGLFGTAIGASWLAGELGDRVQFFVDEDPARIGTCFLGHPVLPLLNMHASSTVFMALPRSIAQRIVARIDRKDVDFILPPDYIKRLNEKPIIA